MEADRLTFLYGHDVNEHDEDLDDVDARSELLGRTFEADLSAVQVLGREIVANQIFAGDPPRCGQRPNDCCVGVRPGGGVPPDHDGVRAGDAGRS